MQLVDGDSVVGGGSAPGQTIPTRLIALRHSRLSAAAMEKRLLAMRPPVIARTESDAVLLDLRTVLPEQDKVLVQALTALSGGASKD
jgi:L-seryl-tRNA(Ser) seleniumtransferase